MGDGRGCGLHPGAGHKAKKGCQATYERGRRGLRSCAGTFTG